jgi:hypothetical protein
LDKAIVVSLHGMQDDNDGVRTSVVISDVSNPRDTDPSFAATKLRLAMDKAPPGVVVSCNLPADDQYGARPLCGSTNVQGRIVNGDSDACHDSVKQATGRFIHMGQDWRVLKPYAQNWSDIDQQPFANSLLEAFRNVVPQSSQ